MALRDQQATDPLVKVAGMTARSEAESAVEMLRGRGIEAQLREDHSGACEVWAPARLEPLARFLLGLSGRSVLRVPRARKNDAKQGRR